jgi:uncharacterized protein (TIGR03435 family)
MTLSCYLDALEMATSRLQIDEGPMKRFLLGIGVATITTAAVFGQAPASPPASGPKPAFEIADVHSSPKSTRPNMRGGAIRDGRWEVRNASMIDLIQLAYNTPADKILGGPSWLEQDRFDLAAKIPDDSKLDQVRQMLQGLLADRFKLVVKEETKTVTGYALTVIPGKSRLRESGGPGAPGLQGCRGDQAASPGGAPLVAVSCAGTTMSALAEQLSRGIAQYQFGAVADKTGLTGNYDFDFKFTPRIAMAVAGADGVTLQDALEKDVGLKLASSEVSSSGLVVQSVNRAPTPNLPNIKDIPAAKPAEFEVAELKPSPPNGPGPNARVLPTGQINGTGITLRQLMSLGWEVDADSMIVGPKFIDTAKFDLVGRAFNGIQAQQQVDDSVLREMLRSFLLERFKMKVHMEDRPVQGFALLADKPKMTKAADPNARTRCFEGPAPGARDLRTTNPVLSRLITCQNASMDVLVQNLIRTTGGYVTSALVDKTGLEGGYDFTVNFSPIGVFRQAANAAAAGGATATASDPNGALSLGDALDRQLGLKLDEQKVSVPVLVVDSMEERAEAN